NFITLEEFFDGSHELLSQAYHPMTIRFFILQAHYRSTVDFSNEALQASERGLERLMDAVDSLDHIQVSKVSDVDVKGLKEKCFEAMNDDLNTPIVISHLFDGAKMINNILAGKHSISAEDLEELKSIYQLFLFDILGMRVDKGASAGEREEAYGKVVDMLLEQRLIAKENKDWATSDKIRDELQALGFEIMDTKEGTDWKLNK
ncbi:MAG: DALR domain-containing protein, partial [Bacteroides sp.]